MNYFKNQLMLIAEENSKFKVYGVSSICRRVPIEEVVLYFHTVQIEGVVLSLSPDWRSGSRAATCPYWFHFIIYLKSLLKYFSTLYGHLYQCFNKSAPSVEILRDIILSYILPCLNIYIS